MTALTPTKRTNWEMRRREKWEKRAGSTEVPSGRSLERREALLACRPWEGRGRVRALV